MLWNKVKRQCPPEFEDDVKQRIANGVKLFEILHYVKTLKKDTRAVLLIAAHFNQLNERIQS